MLYVILLIVMFSITEASYSNKQRTLAELFKPPYDIMFQGTLQEVIVITLPTINGLL